MEIHNHLPLVLECLGRWSRCPTERQFREEYAEPLAHSTGDFFADFHGVLAGLDWTAYRDEALRLDPAAEERRLRGHIRAVEGLFGFELRGEALLLGAFAAMDGYARFDRGTHRVFLGVDESHAQGQYLDILMTHELTHVARESRPEVWAGFGLSLAMTNDEFTESQPVIEHVMGEGFSCAISEILVPGQPLWQYAYQSEASLARVYRQAAELDRAIHQAIGDPDGDYGKLYRIKPLFSQYVWGWQWVKTLLEKHGPPRELVSRCSKDFLPEALAFNLGD